MPPPPHPNPSLKRNREENWSDAEKKTLLALVKTEIHIIEDKSTETNTNKKKNLAWKDVAEKFDLEKKMILSDCLLNLNVKAQYDLSGRILMLPITGNGDASIKLKNTTLHIRYWYEHVTGPDGNIHWNIVKNDLKYEVGRAIFKLENLLGADKRIGDQINRLLNEVWREIIADVGPTIANALSGPVVANVQSLLEQVPYDKFMPDK